MYNSLVLTQDVRYKDKYCLYIRDFGGPDRPVYNRIWRGNIEVAWQLSKLNCVDVDVEFPSELMQWSNDDSVDSRILVLEKSPLSESVFLKLEMSFTDRQPVTIDLWQGNEDIANEIAEVALTYAELQRRTTIQISFYDELIDNFISVEQKISWLFVMKQRKPRSVNLEHGRLSEDQIKKLRIISRFLPDQSRKIETILANEQAMIFDHPGKAMTIIMNCAALFVNDFKPTPEKSAASVGSHNPGGFPAKPDRRSSANNKHENMPGPSTGKSGGSSHNVQKKSRK